MSVSPAKPTKNKRERRGDVLEVARELLADGRSDDLLSLVTQLVEQNHDLTTRVAVATTRAAEEIGRASCRERVSIAV